MFSEFICPVASFPLASIPSQDLHSQDAQGDLVIHDVESITFFFPSS